MYFQVRADQHPIYHVHVYTKPRCSDPDRIYSRGAAQLSTDQRLTSRVQGTDVDMKSNYNPYENTPKESDSTNTLITR